MNSPGLQENHVEWFMAVHLNHRLWDSDSFLQPLAQFFGNACI